MEKMRAHNIFGRFMFSIHPAIIQDVPPAQLFSLSFLSLLLAMSKKRTEDVQMSQ